MPSDLRDALNHALCDELDAALSRIAHCVKQLTDEQLWSRPRADMNSIGNLVLHLTGNVRQMITNNLTGAPDTRDRPAEFAARDPIPGDRLLGELTTAVKNARDAILSTSDGRLCEQKPVNNFNWTGLQAAVRSIAHFRGHAQEIIHMTRTILGDEYQYAAPHRRRRGPVMGNTPGEPSRPSPDEVNRLWQHGMHEERLFHDRLNYFSFLETGLLTICGIMYNKEPAIGFFLPLAVVALLLTLLWLLIQTRHWAYCEHVHSRIRQFVPEYSATLDSFRGGSGTGFAISKPLALAVPVLFVLTWVGFVVWLVVREPQPATTDATLTVERAGLLVLAAVVAYLAWRLRRVEGLLKQPREGQAPPEPKR